MLRAGLILASFSCIIFLRSAFVVKWQIHPPTYVAVAELEYAQDLESCPVRVVGSTPTRDIGGRASWV